MITTSPFYEFHTLDVTKFLKYCRSKNKRLGHGSINIIERMYEAYFKDNCCFCNKSPNKVSLSNNDVPYVDWNNLRSFLVLIFIDGYKKHKKESPLIPVKVFLFCDEGCINMYMFQDPLNLPSNEYTYLKIYATDEGLLDRFFSEELVKKHSS